MPVPTRVPHSLSSVQPSSPAVRSHSGGALAHKMPDRPCFGEHPPSARPQHWEAHARKVSAQTPARARPGPALPVANGMDFVLRPARLLLAAGPWDQLSSMAVHTPLTAVPSSQGKLLLPTTVREHDHCRSLSPPEGRRASRARVGEACACTLCHMHTSPLSRRLLGYMGPTRRSPQAVDKSRAALRGWRQNPSPEMRVAHLQGFNSPLVLISPPGHLPPWASGKASSTKRAKN